MANPIAEALTPFVWGAGGSKKTPDQVAREREIAEALLMKAGNTSPVGHWTQGAARVVDALGGVVKQRRAEAAENEIAGVNKGIISSLLGGSTLAATSSAIPASGASGEISATSPAVSGAAGPEAYRNAIASIESAGSGDYSAIGPTNDKLGRALGRYQIMEANIGPWSQAALGRSVTPDEFLASPEIQDAIFDKQFGQYVEKFGPEGAAQAWFAGPGGVGKVDRKDVLGTTVGDYGQKFTSALGGSPAGAAIEEVAPLEPPREVATMPVASVPEQLPVEVAGGGGRPAGINPAIIEALTNPQASPQTQRLAGILLEQQEARRQAEMEQEAQARDPLRQLQLQKGQLEIDAMRNPQPGFRQLTPEEVSARGLDPSKQYQTSKDGKVSPIGEGGTTVTVNNGEGDKFYENLDKKNAESFAALSEGGVGARSRIAQLGQLETLLSQSPSGAEAGVKLWLGDLGVNTEGLDSLQATRALVEKMVPEQRAPGSGPMSDADIAMYRRSLPAVINQPGGNALVLGTAKAIAEYDIQMGEIADAVADREISPAEGRKRIRELNNPLAGYSEKLKSIRASEREKSTGQSNGWSEVDGVRIRKKAQ